MRVSGSHNVNSNTYLCQGSLNVNSADRMPHRVLMESGSYLAPQKYAMRSAKEIHLWRTTLIGRMKKKHCMLVCCNQHNVKKMATEGGNLLDRNCLKPEIHHESVVFSR